jgi:putative intracellular protease/amidase
MARTVLIPLPDKDFDVTEVSVPWRLLTDAGVRVVFATEEGATPECDPLLLKGVVFGALGAHPEPITFYRQMEEDASFRAPITYRDIDVAALDGLLLPGGHAQGMKQYLESELLRDKIAAFARLGRPLAAICHGVLAAARTVDAQTGQSILHGRKTTCLPKYMERSAWMLTAWKLGNYYRTYPMYVEDEVRAALADPAQFVRGPRTLVSRGTATDDKPAFVVEDGNYLSARWPGDAYLFARKLIAKLEENVHG